MSLVGLLFFDEPVPLGNPHSNVSVLGGGRQSRERGDHLASETLSRSRQLGTAGPSVFPLALGAMGMSSIYGPAYESESIATIEMALDRGITLLDTGDFYGMGHNELLIGRAIRGRRRQALLSVKFGALRAPDGSWIGIDARPAAAKNFLSQVAAAVVVTAILVPIITAYYARTVHEARHPAGSAPAGSKAA